MTEIPNWLWPVLIAPFVGSFLAVLVHRLPLGQSVVFGRSHCESCRQPLSPAELLPIVSYVVQHARCRRCGVPIRFEHPAIELGALIIALWVALFSETTFSVWSNCILGWYLLVLAIIDAKTMKINRSIVFQLVILGIIVNFYQSKTLILDYCIGGFVGYLLFRLIAILYYLLREREGLGAGDANLLAAAGTWVGWFELPSVIFIAALSGIVMSGFFTADRSIWQETRIPFGPFLAFSLFITKINGPIFYSSSF